MVKINPRCRGRYFSNFGLPVSVVGQNRFNHEQKLIGLIRFHNRHVSEKYGQIH
jgi:hypothetical protein